LQGQHAIGTLNCIALVATKLRRHVDTWQS